MKQAIYFILSSVVTLTACHRPEDDRPMSYQTLQLNYSAEDGLWSYEDEDRFFVTSDITSFDESTGILNVITDYPLDPGYCEIVGTNCPVPITDANWSIQQLPSSQWQLTIQLPAATMSAIQDKSLWDEDYWSFDFRIRVLKP